MSWIHVVVAGAGIASMRAAIERGDIDEAARQGALAGPIVIEQALVAPDRATRLAGIVAAPSAAGRPELLDALAAVAGGPDRRVAIPAARAARMIARELAHDELPDDWADADLAGWRAAWVALAERADRWIELRVIALDVAAALDPERTGVPTQRGLTDPDPAFRRAVIALVPSPIPGLARAALADAIRNETEPAVGLAAAAIYCTEPTPDLELLNPAGIDRIKALVLHAPASPAVRDAKRCLR